MNKPIKGMLVGLVATIVLSLLMLMKGQMGLMPDVDITSMLAEAMGGSVALGWGAHFMLGVLVYGVVYAFVFSKLPLGGYVSRGVVLGFLGWLMMMLLMMPMMGTGAFGLGMPSGMMVPVATLMLYLIFGAVLGFVYDKL